MERDVRQIKAHYLPGRNLRESEAHRIFHGSFGRLETIRQDLGGRYTGFEICYEDAEAVIEAPELPFLQKKQLLYAIYDTYFRQLSELPWPLRRKIKADKSIKQMHKAIKGKAEMPVHVNYWLHFCAICLPPLIVGILGEIVFLSLTESAPLWQYVLSLTAMLLGFLVYVIACFVIEGRRLYGGLHKWLLYRQNPKAKAHPMDFFQTAKMLIPLAASLAGALIKLL